MRLKSAIFLSLALGLLPIQPALARKAVIGVNTCGIEHMNTKQQDELIDALQKNGVKTVRVGFGDKFLYFLTHAYKRGIGAIAIVSPVGGVTDKHYAPADKSAGLQWQAELLSDASPQAFRVWFEPQLAALEQAGVRLTAIELGNEIKHLSPPITASPTGSPSGASAVQSAHPLKTDRALGRCRRSRTTFADCSARGAWPGPFGMCGTNPTAPPSSAKVRSWMRATPRSLQSLNRQS